MSTHSQGNEILPLISGLLQSNLGTLRHETYVVYQIYQMQERGEVPEIAHLPNVIQKPSKQQ